MKKLLFYASAVAVLFSSCSKDATEDIAVQAGHEVFTASINIEDENQTRLHLEGAEYIWDVNDAIGVSSATVADANIPVTASKAGSVPSFVVSKNDYTRWLDATKKTTDKNPLYVYFPYQAGKQFTADGVIELGIPTVQRYEANSFFRNEVPAVGYAEAWNGAGQDIELKVPVALLRVNVFGWGELEGIKLMISKGQTNYILSGSNNVSVVPVKGKEYAPALKLNEVEATGETVESFNEDFVEVVFGEKLAEKIAYNATLPVHFVLPADINLSEATLTFIPKFKGARDYDESEKFVKTMARESSAGKMDLRPNLRVTIGDNISFGLKDKFLVMDDENYTAEEKFLAYAYFAQDQSNNKAEELKKMGENHFPTVANILGVTAEEATKMKALLIDTELDFAAYDKAWAKAEYDALDEILVFNEVDDFWKDVYTWYIANGGAIEPLAYNAVIGSKNTTIKNLNVVGTGLTVAADLENLTLQNVTVKAGANSFAGLIASASDIEATVKNVTISTGNEVVAEKAAYVGGIYAKYVQGKNDIEAAEAIKITATNCGVVGRLYGYILSDVALELEAYKWDASVAAYPVIGEAQWNANVTADVVVDAAMINAGVVGKVKINDGITGSVLVGDTYYWNGGKCATNYDGSAYDKDGKVTNPLTAEELATALALGISDYSIVFTHNIDMQGDHMIFSADDDVDPMAVYPFVLAIEKDNHAYKFVVDGKEKTLANVNLTHKGVVTNVTLFGANSTIENITVSGLTINANAAQTNNVAGLANTGKAKNVTVNNVAINVAGEKWYDAKATNHTIGAVFVSVNAKDIENVTANNVAIASAAKASAGLVAGKLELSGETSKLNKIVVTGTNTVAVKDVKSMTVKTAAKLESYKEGTNYAFNAPFGIVKPLDATFSTGGQVNHTLTVENCSYGDKLAAGYWITLKKATSVAPSATAYPSTGYGYVFASNANAGNSEPYNNIAFTK